MPYRRPEDVLKTLLYGAIKNVQELRTSVSAPSIDKCCITKMASTAQRVDHTKKGYELRVLN